MEPVDFREVVLERLEAGARLLASIPVAGEGTSDLCAIPVMVISGRQPGPVFCVNAGTHGDEHEGQVAVHRLWDELDPDSFRGVVLCVPHLNMPACREYSRTSSIDLIDLNRICPGRADGFLTERIAVAFFEHLCPRLDYLIDVHSGGPRMDTAPVVIYREQEGSTAAARSIELASALGTELVWRAPVSLGGGGGGGTLAQVALERGVPAVTYEMGGRGAILDDCLREIDMAVRNCLRLAGMMDGEVALRDRYILVDGWFSHGTHGGIYQARAAVSEAVREGQVVGEISGFDGRLCETVRSPHDGIVLSQRVSTLRPGDWTICVGRILENGG